MQNALEVIEREMRAEIARVEKGSHLPPECAPEVPLWRVEDWADRLAQARQEKWTVTDAMQRAGIDAYEDAMDGQRLPDGDGYDGEVVSAIFTAMLRAAPTKENADGR